MADHYVDGGGNIPVRTRKVGPGEPFDCIMLNQVEIMSALSLLLRYAMPGLAGKGGELDKIREDLYRRHNETMRALSSPLSSNKLGGET